MSWMSKSGRGRFFWRRDESAQYPTAKPYIPYSCSWLLLHEFAKLYQQRLDREMEDQVPLTDVDRPMNIELPKTTYGKARVIMTRAGEFDNVHEGANIAWPNGADITV